MAVKTTQLQLRRGTDEENDVFTGAEGELTYDITNQSLRIHDGLTEGGILIDKSINLVHKAETEIISGEKIFTGWPSMQNTVKARTENDEDWKACINFMDKNHNPVGQIATERHVNDANQNIYLYTCTDSGNGTNNWHEILKGYWDSTTDTNTIESGIFAGTANQAKWADLAENYESDNKYSVGTLIKFGGEKDITIADTECNGVISDKPGYLLDSNLKEGLPVALVGKTPLRVIGKVHRFDKIVLSSIPGVATVKTSKEEKVIAIALEASDNEEEKLVKCVTKFNLD